MPVYKVKRGDGYHCFWCNASTSEAASFCARCGEPFAGSAPATATTCGRSATTAASAQTRLPESWKRDYRRLILWFLVALVVWLVGLALVVSGLASQDGGPLSAGAGLVIPLYLLAYVVAVVYAYRVQKGLNKAGLYKHGAWQVVVGALILNAFLGLLIVGSVLATAYDKKKDAS